MPLLEMLLDLPELEPLSSPQGIQELLLPSTLLPYRAQVLYIYILSYVCNVWGKYIYINTCMSYFINIYMHRKTKKMHVKILKVNFLWVAKLSDFHFYLCAFLYFPPCSVFQQGQNVIKNLQNIFHDSNLFLKWRGMFV